MSRESPRRALFKCDDCGMEIHLLAPVERPCPACGGTFIEQEDADIDLGYKPPERRQQIRALAIERLVRESMPEIYAGFDQLLWENSPDGLANN